MTENELYGEDSVRRNLQDRLLDAVKQCQTHFGARHEVATESDLRVLTLCLEWEAVFTHGLKKTRSKMISISTWGKNNESAGGFWHVIKPLISEEDRDRFTSLRNITTDLGRGRAWLRTAINERMLENCLHTILGSVPHLKTHYDSHSFLLDHERSSILPIVAAGLNSIIFSISVDSDYLNSPARDIVVPTAAAPAVLQPLTTSTSSSSGPSFVERLSTVSSMDGEDEVVAVKKTRRKKKRPSRSPSPSSRYAAPPITNPAPPITNPAPPTTNPAPPTTNSAPPISNPTPPPPVSTYSPTPPPSPNRAGLVHTASEELLDVMDATGGSGSISPVAPGSSRASSPSLLSDDGTGSGRLLFVAPSDPEEAIRATSMVLAATESHDRMRESERAVSPSTQVTGSGTMSESELKQALLSLVRSKQEIEELNTRLEDDIVQQRKHCETLEERVRTMEHELTDTRENHTQSLQALERENDLLREQLRRQLSMTQHSSPLVSGDKKDEKKLSEMAEMYGEVIEFNDRLHQQLVQKNTIIIRLAHTLITTGIELPVPANKLPPEALTPKKLVEVSIPSVIKKGRGPEAHHVYQVFVQVNDDEWNIYRRFAEFWEFHNQLIKHVPEAAEFSFPSRRAIGNKTAAVVEERRLKLQDYLRYILELCAKPTVKRKTSKAVGPIIHPNMSKDEFLRHFPFFREGTSSQYQERQPPVRAPSYSGL